MVFSFFSQPKKASALSSRTLSSEAGSSQCRSLPDGESERKRDDCVTLLQRLSSSWTLLILRFHSPILATLQKVTKLAALNPVWTIASTFAISTALFGVGLSTNFNVDVDEAVLWTPANSLPIKHYHWIGGASGFSDSDSVALFVFHEDGQNVLGKAQVERVFQVLDGVLNLPGYHHICSQSSYMDPYQQQHTCEILGINRFWNNSASAFAFLSGNEGDHEVIKRLSARRTPDGSPVADEIFGRTARDNTTDLLVEAKAFAVRFLIPDVNGATELETLILELGLNLRTQWQQDENGFHFRAEVITKRSFSDEFERAIAEDLALVPIAFGMMFLFTTFFFARTHRVYSRSLLGVSALVCVLFSIMSGFGLLFAIGVTFTSMTQLVPFVVFGIGIDDAFIIMGAYARTDCNQDIIIRIEKTVNDIGVAITLTSLTSALAFAVGCMSSVPVVYWLCLYAFPTVLFVYIYQLTFFVACVVLDEQRIQHRRRDCLVCVTVNKSGKGEEEGQSVEDKRQKMYERWMRAYARVLLKPSVKVLVVLLFAALAGACAYSASSLTQEFSFTEVMPKDSYVKDMVEALEDHAGRTGFAPHAYFRDVNHSDPIVQKQMVDYVNELVAMDSVTRPPDFFWLTHLQQFVNDSGVVEEPFERQIDAFMKNPVYFKLYHKMLVVNESSGLITASRVKLFMDNVSSSDVNEQIRALKTQRSVSAGHPINAGKSDLAFFLYDSIFNIWEFYSIAVDELVLTTLIGITVMSGVTLIFVPHWTAVLFVCPLISLLYVDLLGVLQWAGVHINAVSYISVVISIGLLVDFVLHMLIRFYECQKGSDRHERTVEMLETMGVSIMVGGLTTFLGTMPLAFSTSSIFFTVFVAFLGLVVLGMAHALVLLPVVLSAIGPQLQDRPTVEMAAQASAESIHS